MKSIEEYLTPKIKNEILKRTNFTEICEVRLRVNLPLIIHLENSEIVFENCIISSKDIKEVFNNITGYSAYAYEYSIKNGFLTLDGGHRVGFGGETVYENGKIINMKNIRFLNIRICHSLCGCGRQIADYIKNKEGIFNTLIISPPGLGKTTLLRDLVRIISSSISGTSICVIDERNEISGSSQGIPSVDLGIRTDVISNCSKTEGINMAVRSMAPKIIAVDEIGGQDDLKALSFAGQSGVSIIATAHGENIQDVEKKLGETYRCLFEKKIVIEKKGEYICY